MQTDFRERDRELDRIRYSYRKASIGARREARTAGHMPTPARSAHERAEQFLRDGGQFHLGNLQNIMQYLVRFFIASAP